MLIVFFGNFSRSPTSYLLNPDQNEYPDGDTDKIMTVWRLQDESQNDLGAIVWFAVHGTSMNQYRDGDSSSGASFVSDIVLSRHEQHQRTHQRR